MRCISKWVCHSYVNAISLLSRFELFTYFPSFTIFLPCFLSRFKSERKPIIHISPFLPFCANNRPFYHNNATRPPNSHVRKNHSRFSLPHSPTLHLANRSLGVLTYVLLTGFLPFGGDNDQETFLQISKGELDFPAELFEDISPEAIDFMKRLLLRQPE